MRVAWWQPPKLIIGLHTRMIADRITRAVDDYMQGRSSFLCFKVPFRHGKSDIVSRAAPAYFLGRCAKHEPDIIMTGYGADLVESFSRKAKAIVQSESYQRIFPHVRLSQSKRTDAAWKAEYKHGDSWELSAGEVHAVGLGGAITGAGYSLGVLDDYCKNRQEAESPTYRERTWESFVNDFMTRRAPVSITIVTATPWNVDDVFARIEKSMDKDPDFPRFEFMTFPARGHATINGERVDYPSEYLFTGRFPESWYKEQYASLGLYSAAGLLDCNPTVRGGNQFNLDHVVIHESISEFPDIPYARGWDLASTEKQLAKGDPDFTCGVLGGVHRAPNSIVPELWIKDVVYGQWKAPMRDSTIHAVAERDGAAVKVLIEAFGGYKDTAETMKSALRGLRIVQGVHGPGDKVVKASPMEPVFESGNVHILRAKWNEYFLNTFATFPLGLHDDVVDATAIVYNYTVKPPMVARSFAI